MGCDIHIWAETKIDGKWLLSTKAAGFNNRRHEFNHCAQDEEEKWRNMIVDASPYAGRNYYLFAMLANVRNYHNEVVPISEPRGVPDDASDIYLKIVKFWDGDGHSHSYLTLKELHDAVNEREAEFASQTYFIKTYEYLLKLASDPNVEDVRLVFFFDN